MLNHPFRNRKLNPNANAALPKLALLALAASLSACGGSSSDAPDPLQSYRDQKLAWAGCEKYLPTKQGSALTQQLGSRLQCVLMRAPKDWAKPESGDIDVAVMRVAAGDPKARRGALAFNPGGPGADGLKFGLQLFTVMSASNPASEQGALQLRLVNEYDFVGFSPRGTGFSTALNCKTNAMADFIDQSPSGALAPENWASVLQNSKATADACRADPLTPYINSDATARDMDLLRGLLGDAKLNYFGYSYGTWLGGWYASLFPDKVGRMVLDSSEDFTSTHEEATLAMGPARQRIHEQVLLPYAARHNDYFDLGTDAAAIGRMIESLSPRMQDVLADTLPAETLKSTDADSYLNTVVAARGLDAVLATASNPNDGNAIKAAINTHTFVSGNSARNEVIRTVATVLFDDEYEDRWLDRSDEPLLFLPTYWAVSCNDSKATTDGATWMSISQQQIQKAPLTFSAALTNPCLTWGGPNVSKPNVSAMKGLDILMVQSQFDGATPTEGANRYFAELSAAKRVYVPGEFSHGIFPYSDNCVDNNVVRYLLGESPKVRETSCAATPLAQDPKLQSAAISTYLNPKQTQAQIDEFKNRIGAGRR